MCLSYFCVFQVVVRVPAGIDQELDFIDMLQVCVCVCVCV